MGIFTSTALVVTLSQKSQPSMSNLNAQSKEGNRLKKTLKFHATIT